MAKVVLTGASSGIGAAAAVELTRLGHEVVILGRSPAKLEAVHGRMGAVAPSEVELQAPVQGDFASLEEVRRIADLIDARHPDLDVLVNNAGIETHERQLSHDGFELTFAVNHLAPFLLTTSLAGRLQERGARVVTTASDNHHDGDIDLADLQLERGWSGPRAYDRSKLANVLFTLGLRDRLGLAASCFHPGSISTDLNRDAPFLWLQKPLEKLRYGRPSVGAETLVWLATSSEGEAPRAVYYERRQAAEASEEATDRRLASALWDASERLISGAIGDVRGKAMG